MSVCELLWPLFLCLNRAENTPPPPLPAPDLIHPLCSALTRYHNVLGHEGQYKEEEKRNDFKKEMKETPVYRSFFQHKLFDKNMLHLIKQQLEEPLIMRALFRHENFGKHLLYRIGDYLEPGFYSRYYLNIYKMCGMDVYVGANNATQLLGVNNRFSWDVYNATFSAAVRGLVDSITNNNNNNNDLFPIESDDDDDLD